jgi:hypothetical protein
VENPACMGKSPGRLQAYCINTNLSLPIFFIPGQSFIIIL